MVLLMHSHFAFRYLKCDLANFDLRELDSEFDVILIEPPLYEYQRSMGVVKDKFWSWEEVKLHAIMFFCGSQAYSP